MAINSPTHKPLSVAAACSYLLERARAVTETEIVPLQMALGRVLAAPVVSALDVPHWDYSAMDGYAIHTADLATPTMHWPISQRIAAGQVGQLLTPHTAARIFTGAPIPAGADAVIMQEWCQLNNGQMQLIDSALAGQITAGMNIRRCGEEITAGQSVLTAGTVLQAPHLALAASIGQAQVTVYRRLRVALITTGNELVTPGQPLLPGQIYDANRVLLRALLTQLGCDIIDIGPVADERGATVVALTHAAAIADLMIASGGVSVGEEDHIRPAVAQLGTVELTQVAMRPGKPVVFGQIGNTPLLGTPGNPVSTFVTFLLFARPLIMAMQGVLGVLTPSPIAARAGFTLNKPDKRCEYQRARLEWQPNELPLVRVFPSRSSAAITSLTWAQGLVIIPAHTSIALGDPVTFLAY